MSERKKLTLKARVEAFAANALCPKCFKPFNGDVEFDHEQPLGLDGPDHDEVALVPLHAECHEQKETVRHSQAGALTKRYVSGWMVR